MTPEQRTDSKNLILRPEVPLVLNAIKVFDISVNYRGAEIESKEVTGLIQLVSDFKSGKMIIPEPQEFWEISTTTERHKITSQVLKGILASLISKCTTDSANTFSLRQEMGKQVNRLEFFLNAIDGKDIIVAEMQEFNDLERAIMYQIMSVNLKKELDYPDMDECSEKEMARYIVGAVYYGHQTQEDQFRGTDGIKRKELSEEAVKRLEKLIPVIVERDGEAFEARLVIENLNSLDYSENLFRRIVEAAEIGDFLDMAECFFQFSGITRRYAHKCSDIRRKMDYGELEDEDLKKSTLNAKGNPQYYSY